MKKNSKNINNSDEIDLVVIIKNLWQGKWIILFMVFIASLAVVIFFQLQPKKVILSFGISMVKVSNSKYLILDEIIEKLTADLTYNKEVLENKNNFSDTSNTDKLYNRTDKLYNREITIIEESVKRLNFIKLSPQLLLNLYLENLTTYEVVEEAVRISNLFKNQNYSTVDYQNKVQSIINSIKVIQLRSVEQAKQQLKEIEKLFYEYKLDFTFNDSEKGKLFLINLDKVTNKRVRDIILQNFNENIDTFEYLTTIKLDEIDYAIQIELYTHEQETKKRIEFLKEQAKIARALEIARNTIKTEKFSLGSGAITNVTTDTPFYFRGYEAIEKEIELIQARVDPNLFAKEITKLEKQKKYLKENKNINNLKFVFNNSDLTKKEKFVAAHIFELQSKINSNFKKILLIVIFISLMIGSIFVLIRQSFQKQN